MSDVIYQASAAGGEFRLHISGSFLQLYQDNTLVESYLLADVDSFTLNGGDGNETLRIDELIALSGGIFFNGGLPNSPPGDGILIAIQGLTTGATTFTNATDGVITLVSGGTMATYHFTGVDPVDMTGSTVTDLVFNLPGGTNTQLEDDATTGNNVSQLRDTLAGFDITTFAHPTGSLTINGTATDNVNVNLVDNLGIIGLTINASTTTFTSLGATTTLASVTTDATGTTAINNGGITTTGAQSYNDAVTLGANTMLTSTGAGAIEFGGTLNGAFDLVVNTAGGTNFFAVVGGGTPLSSITTDAPGLTRVAANITTIGAQTYGDQLALFANVILTSIANGDINFAQVDNNSSLTVDTAGTTRFNSAVGSLVALASLTTDAPGATALNGGSVTTNGAQSYNDAVTLGANTVLTSIGAGNLSFANIINGAFSLTANTAGTTTFGGAVGGSTVLTSVTTDAPGATALNGGLVITTGAQKYHDAVILGANELLTSTAAGDITFDLAVANNGFGLSVNTAGAGLFSGAIAGLGGFTQNGSGTTTLAAANTYIGATSINAGTLLVNGSIGNSATTVANGGTLAGSGTIGGSVTVQSGGHVAPGTSPGMLTTGSFNLQGGGSFDVQIAGTTAGTQYDQLAINGTVTLAGALNVSLLGGFVPTIGNTFKIIDNNGTADAVSGTFSNITGSTFAAGGITYSINYAGADGNDVVITAIGLNNAPVLSGLTASVLVPPFGGPKMLSPGALVSDVDGTTLSSATVRVSTGTFVGDGDILAVAAGGLTGTSITPTYNAATEALTLSGVDTLAHYQQVLDNVTFQTISSDPTNSGANRDRTIEWQLNDGSGVNNLSTPQHTTVHLSTSSTSDFNADGRADIFWQTNGGSLAVWQMNGFQISAADFTRLGASAVGLPGPDWHVIDTSDVSGDGKSDILWRTDAGKLAVWQMDGSHIIGADFLRIGATAINAPGSDWHPLGAADFDGDGKGDLLWRTDGGQLAIWELNGFQIKAADFIKAGNTNVGVPASDWHIVGTGDFGGDGKADILWETTGGALALWQMDGTHIQSASFIKAGATNVGIPGFDWHVSDVADFDGDGKGDILWRVGAAENINSALTGLPPGGGQVAIWEMNGDQIKFADFTKAGATNVGAPGLDWHLLGADDANGDGKADLLWQTDSGALAIWQMDGTHVAAADYTKIGATNTGVPAPDWHVYQHHYDII